MAEAATGSLPATELFTDEINEEPMEFSARDKDGFAVKLYRLLEAEVTIVETINSTVVPPVVTRLQVNPPTNPNDVYDNPIKYMPARATDNTPRF